MARRVMQVFSWDRTVRRYLAPVLAVVIVAMVVLNLPQMIGAARDDGRPGIATVTREDCGGRGTCSYYGRFVADDGETVYDDALIEGRVDRVGDTVRGQVFDDSRVDKVYAPSSHEWVIGLVVGLGAIVFLVVWGRGVALPRLRARRR